jgi:hypothetical protein
VSRGSVLARGRIAAEAGMQDECTIRRTTGRTTDPDTGASVPTYDVLYTGKCRVQASLAQAARADAGEDYLLLLRLEVHLPMSVTGLKAGDEIVITDAAYDPDLPGRVFRIHDLAHKTHATARRVGVIEKTGS